MKERPVLFTAAAVVDEGGVVAAGPDACLLVEAGPIARREMPVLLATGSAARGHALAPVAERVERPGSVLLPGLVNAHAHLDLTAIGPCGYDPAAGFVSWVDRLRSARPVEATAVADAVRLGVELCRRGGTVAVGDIAGAARGRPSLVPWEVLGDSGMLGVSFLEFFAVGKGAASGMAAAEAALAKWRLDVQGRTLTVGKGAGSWVKLGLQPHAPNTVGMAGYRRAVELSRESGLPLSTHLAETWEEREFIGWARGGQREFLERLGLWDDDLLGEIGGGAHPVQHLKGVLESAPFLAAHVNDADDAAIETLAATGTTVVYCPRASEYFGAERRFGAHRYREMMSAGVRVVLGTDSILNLDTPGRISVLDEMRLLYRRDGTDAATLLRLGTTEGARALGLDPEWFRFRTNGCESHAIAGVVAVPCHFHHKPGDQHLREVLRSDAAPELLLDRTFCCNTGIIPTSFSGTTIV